MLASFIILYHPTRIDNLQQTIRFLKKREKKLLDQEFIFVCQTNYDLKIVFQNQINLNLSLKNYHKSFMTNYAVLKSKGEFLILLDSDRILPENYFFNSIKKSNKNTILSTINLYQLSEPYTDLEIESDKTSKTPDFRKFNIDQHRKHKNLFAGNTLLSRDAYEKLGGYDESFIGYGFADSDMSQRAIKNKLDIIWLSLTELHLFHEKNICWDGEIISQDIFQIITAINALKYYKKWNMYDENIKNFIMKIYNKLNNFPIDLQKIFLENLIHFIKLN